MSFVAVFYGLALAHFIADYMQPAALVAWTKHNGGGLFVHTGIYAILTAAVLYGSGPLWIPALGVLTLSHFGFDWLKYRFSARQKGNHLQWFLLDQACHGSVIVLIALVVAAQSGPPGWFVAFAFNNIDILVIASAIIAAAFGGSILVFEAARTLAPGNDNRVISLRERLPGMLERTLACVFLFVSPWPWLTPLSFGYTGTRLALGWQKPESRRRTVEFVASITGFLMAAAFYYVKGYV